MICMLIKPTNIVLLLTFVARDIGSMTKIIRAGSSIDQLYIDCIITHNELCFPQLVEECKELKCE